MGKSFSVWSVRVPDVPGVLGSLGWREREGHYEMDGGSFIAGASGPRPVLTEDAPKAAQALVAGISWLVELGFEGGGVAAERVVTKAAKELARQAQGAVVWDEDQTAWSPGGKRRVPKERSLTGYDLLTLSWWAAGGPLLTEVGLLEFLQVLQRWLPEAVPNRWDLVEPPSHFLRSEGIQGLAAFLHANRDEVLVLWSNPPFLGLELDISVNWGADERVGFRATWVEMAVQGDLLNDVGWAKQLARSFEELSVVIAPFYAEARVREGGRWSRHDGAGAGSLHPIRRMYWAGFPHVQPFARVVGLPYRERWATPPGRQRGPFIVMSGDDWVVPHPARLPAPPEEFLQRFDSRYRYYHHGVVTHGTAFYEKGKGGFTVESPSQPAAFWPFQWGRVV